MRDSPGPSNDFQLFSHFSDDRFSLLQLFLPPSYRAWDGLDGMNPFGDPPRPESKDRMRKIKFPLNFPRASPSNNNNNNR